MHQIISDSILLKEFYNSLDDTDKSLLEYAIKQAESVPASRLKRATDLIEYFVKRVEEGSIRSIRTYKMYKQFLDEIVKLEMIKQVRDGDKIKFYWTNNAYLGYAYKEIDGYYVFQFNKPSQGFWSDYSLKAVADALTALNKGWDAEIKSVL